MRLSSPVSFRSPFIVLASTAALLASACATTPQCEPGTTCPSTCESGECPKACPAGTDRWQSDTCEAPPAILLNTVGFLPDHAKVATVRGSATSFSVKRVSDGTDAFTGTAGAPKTDSEGGGTISIADFSTFMEPGEYYLDVPGVGRSVKFRIGSDVYSGVLSAAMLGLYGQRCGTAVSLRDRDGRLFEHGACHTDDAVVNETNEAFDVTGGWHDAGDYGKYSNNAAFALGNVLTAWEHFGDRLKTLSLPIPEHGGTLPDFLAEAKYQMDQLLKMQREDGSVYYQVSRVEFEGFLSPTGDSMGPRRIFGWGTVHTASVAAVAAQASRIFQPYDAEYAARCLAVAQKAWAFLKANQTYVEPNMTAAHHDGYNRSRGGCATAGTCDLPDRLWAAAELWAATGDPEALAAFESSTLAGSVDGNFEWANPGNLGRFTYLMSKREGRDPAVVAKLTASVVATAQGIVYKTNNHPYGRGLDGYWWGSNGSTMRLSMNLVVANTLQPDPTFLDALVAQLDWILGRNVFGRTFVTGLGAFPVMYPHHRPSLQAVPWPGLVVGGPNGGATAWEDNQGKAEMNEIAINWSGAFVYAAAALLR